MMTIREYIVGKLSLMAVDYPEDLIAFELSKIGLEAEETISAEINLDLFFYNILPDVLLRPTSISEGGYSVSFDRNALENYYNSLCKKLNKPSALINPSNQIKDITNQW